MGVLSCLTVPMDDECRDMLLVPSPPRDSIALGPRIPYSVNSPHFDQLSVFLAYATATGHAFLGSRALLAARVGR
jgi:hypothetical protein